MSSRTRSRKQASIGSNHSLRRPTPISASEPRTGNFVLLLVMAWSPPAHNAGNVRVSAPGDYATFNSNHTPDGTPYLSKGSVYFAGSGDVIVGIDGGLDRSIVGIDGGLDRSSSNRHGKLPRHRASDC